MKKLVEQGLVSEFCLNKYLIISTRQEKLKKAESLKLT